MQCLAVGMTALLASQPEAQRQYRPFVASRADEARDKLWQRFQRNGYLYIPGALDLGRCESLREAMLGALQPHLRWDDTLCSPVLEGEPFFESDPLWDALYPRIQALETFHALFHEPALQQLMTVVAGEHPFVYPMKMARIAAPGKIGYETPPHQDAYSHHAGPAMAGIWVALHDADAAMGRLTILPGSHLGGVRPVHPAQGVGGVQCEVYPHETLWHVSDVGAGDVVIFHSRTVHRAQPNVDDRRWRLSVDTRFCPYGEPVFSTNLEPHHGWRIPKLDWEYVYRNWRRRDLCYYWRDYPALF
jgi:hypothetical protein